MFADIKNRIKKANQPPGTPIYTGNAPEKASVITVITFDPDHCDIKTGADLASLLPTETKSDVVWIHIEGLHDAELIKKLAEHYTIHPLTVEDILNVEQRPKVEEYENYLFTTLKSLRWDNKTYQFSTEQLSIVFGKQFIITFQELHSNIIDAVQKRLQNTANQRLRQQGSDYLVYRLIDGIVDEYFVVLEGLGEKLEAVEARIIESPTPQNSKTIYRLKREMLLLRKVVWPLREVLSHLLYEDNAKITKFTRVYLRDAYDHVMQAIDTVETFRDMLSSMLDMYLSGLTIRMNEIMKTLTIITTIFIPITALASIYGMNLIDIPLMKSHKGFYFVSGMMAASISFMIYYFHRKKWI